MENKALPKAEAMVLAEAKFWPEDLTFPLVKRVIFIM